MEKSLSVRRRLTAPKFAMGMLPALFASLGSFPASAANDYSLANGAGISHPSMTDSIDDNPAAFSFVRQTNILGAASSEVGSFNPFNATGHLGFGNGSVGGAIGLHSFKQGGEDRLAVDYGLGAYADSLKTSIGIGGYAPLKKDTLPGPDSQQINVGAVMNPQGSTQVGVGLIGILNGANYYTSGITTALSAGTLFSVDASATPQLKGKTIEPALGFHQPDFQFSGGYGLRLDKEANTWIRSGFTAGVGLRLGRDIELQGEYNHHAKYYVSLIANI